jgi:2,4-dienoyl-CoA reductase-like NADH-dependent reductase (Old Yellow Enzyme family)
MVYRDAPSKALLHHHRAMAAGGVGLTTVAYGAVSDVGRTLQAQVWLRPEILPELKALADAVHAEGGAISYQITHGGSFITSRRVKGATMSAMSGFNKAGFLRGNLFHRAMNRADMEQVTEQFVNAARVCRDAGFDAVEIHMGHGYLLNQFISPLSNRRTDEYGGSALNRVRFPAEVLARVKAAVGNRMAVIAKINVADGCPAAPRWRTASSPPRRSRPPAPTCWCSRAGATSNPAGSCSAATSTWPRCRRCCAATGSPA